MDSKTSDFVGFFRDGKRRIDIVIVMKDGVGAEAEELRTDFLLNALKFGLQMEIEEGKYERHKYLTFIKVHTPANLIEEYGVYFNIRKYFRESHMEFLHPKNEFIQNNFPRIANLINRSNPDVEKEWLKIVRKNYQDSKNYSNLERSVITYKLLMLIPFQSDELHIGIKWLLTHNVVLDAFALHDGPYFKTQDYNDDNLPNARQLLFNNWVKQCHILKQQPLHLINEYLGERIALYFAFFGMYNKALILSAIFGIMTFALGIMDFYVTEHISWRSQDVCDPSMKGLQRKGPDLVCPLCRDFFACPFTNTTEYCFQATVIDMLDSRFNLIYAFFICFWAIIFVSVWKRFEYFLSWLWEINNKSTVTMRSEFLNDFNLKRSSMTGIVKKGYSKAHLFIRSFFSFGIATIFVLSMIMTTVLLVIMKYHFHSVFYGIKNLKDVEVKRLYISGIIFGLTNAAASILLEIVSKKLAYALTTFENHRTEEVFERSLILKLTVFTMTNTFSYFIYFTFVRELLYTYPTDENRWEWLGGISFINCGAIGCYDDIFLILFSLIFLRVVANKLSALLLNVIFGMKTDYNRKYLLDAGIPCWEREFMLQPVTEKVILYKYESLVIQFALVTWFVTVFPLASALVLPINIWDIRFNAKQILLRFRRPLLFIKPAGPGSWGKVLIAMAFIAALTNPVTFVLTSRTIDLHIYQHQTANLMRTTNLTRSKLLTFFDYTSGAVNLEHYAKSKNAAMRSEFIKYHKLNHRYLTLGYSSPNFDNLAHCRFAGYKTPRSKDNRICHTRDTGWYTYYINACFVFLFEHLFIAVAFIFYYLIPKIPRDVQETMAIEEKLKTKRNLEVTNKDV